MALSIRLGSGDWIFHRHSRNNKGEFSINGYDPDVAVVDGGDHDEGKTTARVSWQSSGPNEISSYGQLSCVVASDGSSRLG